MAGREQRIKRESISLACLSCGTRNYRTTKARRLGAAPLILKKYCKTCDQHTEHRESR